MSIGGQSVGIMWVSQVRIRIKIPCQYQKPKRWYYECKNSERILYQFQILQWGYYVDVRGQIESILCVSEDPVKIFMWLSENTVWNYVSDRDQSGSCLRSKCPYFVLVRDQNWGFMWVSEGTVMVLCEYQWSQYSYYVSEVALMILCVRGWLRI